MTNIKILKRARLPSMADTLISKRSAMGWACSQNEAQAPTETAPLLAAEDEQVNQSKPRL